ncbi:MAG: LacI family DNA-binding transcriptional regulator, partial [Verrucomicrobiota bacterium]
MGRSKANDKINSTTALAEHLGLSRWTVSRALNGHAGVKPETVERVRTAMEELGFAPNVLARGLRGGKTGVVGVCFQTFGTPVFSKKLITLQNELRKRDYRAIIELIDDNASLERQVVSHFLSMRVDGIVFVGGPNKENLSYIEELAHDGSLSVVTMDPVYSSSLREVSLDRSKAMSDAMEKLYDLGHRKIALMGINKDILYGGRRIAALKESAEKLGMDWRRDIRILNSAEFGTMDYRSGRGLAELILNDSKFDSTGIVAINDQVAIAAIGRLAEEGIRTPKDYSIVGFDNLDVARHM